MITKWEGFVILCIILLIGFLFKRFYLDRYTNLYTDSFAVEVKNTDVSNIPGYWVDIIIPDEAIVEIFTSKRKIKKKFHKPQTFQFKHPADEEIEMIVISMGSDTYKIVRPPNKYIIVPDESNIVRSNELKTANQSIKLDLSAPEFRDSTVTSYFKGKSTEAKMDVPRVITLAGYTERVIIKTPNCRYVLNNLKPGTVHKPKNCQKIKD